MWGNRAKATFPRCCQHSKVGWGAVGSVLHWWKQGQSPLKLKFSQTGPFGSHLPAEGARCWYLVFTKSLGVMFSRDTAESRPKLPAVSPSSNFLMEFSCQAFVFIPEKWACRRPTPSTQSFSRIPVRPKLGWFHFFTGGSTSVLWKRIALEKWLVMHVDTWQKNINFDSNWSWVWLWPQPLTSSRALCAEKAVGPSPLSLNIPDEDAELQRRTVAPQGHPDDSTGEELSPLPFSHTTLCGLWGPTLEGSVV